MPLLVLVGGLICSLPVAADEAAEHFEERVRPLLVEHCQGCHNADDQQGGVRLDLRSGIFGSVAGQRIVDVESPSKSRLLQVIAYATNDIQMPPDGQLPVEARETLAKWISAGAYWPESDEPSADEGRDPFPRREDGSIDYSAAAETHWSYRPIERPLPPIVHDDRVRTPIDAFVVNRLSEAGLELSDPTDRATLIRRMSFDVLGLPPTYDEVERFKADSTFEAVSVVIDRLLADPGYGERWGRHWLDVARYADTTGYRTANKSQKYGNAYTYRDWVVSALNRDVPYDEFIRDQIAADVLAGDDDARQAALGFLSVGPVFTDSRVEQINDQIDVLTRGVMGMTVTCARCHDHKFDPIPTADYYSLYGVFDSTDRVADGRLLPVRFESSGLAEFRGKLAELEAKVATEMEGVYAEIQKDNRERLGDYLVAAAVDLGVIAKERRPKLTPDLRARSVSSWRNLLKNRKSHPTVRVLWQLADLPGQDDFAGQVVSTATALIKKGSNEYSQPFLEDLAENPPASFEDSIRRLADRVQAGGDAFVSLLAVKPAPTAYPAAEIRAVADRDLSTKIQKAEQAVDDFWATHPAAPPKAMSVREGRPHDERVFIRGNIGRRGDVAPRRFPQVLSAVRDDRFHEGSGRGELARAVTDDRNPLTARVIVNRVWKHHFGYGLVRTPSDFGIQGERPTHPELLDFLASELIAHDWSLKWLHREILLSAVYQQSSASDAANAKVDPENRLLWRQNRRRLEFEPMRDALLAVAATLDLTIGGKAVPLMDQSRRSIYLHVDRNNPPSLRSTFDFPSADQTSPKRSETSVPQQALFYLNNEWVGQLAKRLTKQLGDGRAEERVDRLFQRVLSRLPSDDERAILAGLVEESPVAACRALLMSNEFLFVD